MAVPWSNLPTDIVSLIDKTLNTDVDTLRLRSVCSSWRSSIRPRLRPSPFPLKLPTFASKSNSAGSQDCYFILNLTTLYHLSPPKHGPTAGDPSDGWLIRAFEVNPSRFSLFAPLFPNFAKYPSGAVPSCLNLLDYRVYEVCKCYHMAFVNSEGTTINSWPIVRKNMVLWNYAVGCEFVVLSLLGDSRMSYWKLGDKEWTSIDTKGYNVTDVIVFRGKLYAISLQRVLVSFDSEFNLNVVHFPKLPTQCAEYESSLLEYKSDLYVVTKILKHPSDPDEEAVKDLNEVPLRLEIFKKCDNWQHVTCLGNDMFLSSDDLCVGLSWEDFRGIKSNCVYMAHTDDVYRYRCGPDILYGMYNLDVGQTTSIMTMDQDHALLYRPSPRWLPIHSSSSSS